MSEPPRSSDCSDQKHDDREEEPSPPAGTGRADAQRLALCSEKRKTRRSLSCSRRYALTGLLLVRLHHEPEGHLVEFDEVSQYLPAGQKSICPRPSQMKPAPPLSDDLWDRYLGCRGRRGRVQALAFRTLAQRRSRSLLHRRAVHRRGSPREGGRGAHRGACREGDRQLNRNVSGLLHVHGCPRGFVGRLVRRPRAVSPKRKLHPFVTFLVPIQSVLHRPVQRCVRSHSSSLSSSCSRSPPRSAPQARTARRSTAAESIFWSFPARPASTVLKTATHGCALSATTALMA